jgi:hypothetical protein
VCWNRRSSGTCWGAELGIVEGREKLREFVRIVFGVPKDLDRAFRYMLGLGFADSPLEQSGFEP